MGSRAEAGDEPGNCLSVRVGAPISGAFMTFLCRPVYMSLSGRSISFGILYVAGLAVLCFVTAEVFLRLTLPAPQGYFVWPPHMHVVFEPNDTATPGITGPGHFQTNSLGLRSDEPMEDRERTIYVFGGSTGADVYLDQREAWVTALQDRLNAKPGQPKTWVGNLSRSSLSTLHALLQFEYLVPSLPKPDMFIAYAGVNDLQLALKSSYLPDMDHETHMDWTFNLRPGPDSLFGNLAVARFWRRIEDWWSRAAIGVTQTYTAEGFNTWRACRQSAPPENLVQTLPDLQPALAEYRANLNKMIDHAKEYDAEMIFVTQAAIWSDDMAPEDEALLLAAGLGPNGEWCNQKRYFSPSAMAAGLDLFNETMLDVCRNRGVRCIDLGARLAKTGAHFYDDMHFNEGGASEAARIVSEEITK